MKKYLRKELVMTKEDNEDLKNFKNFIRISQPKKL